MHANTYTQDTHMCKHMHTRHMHSTHTIHICVNTCMHTYNTHTRHMHTNMQAHTHKIYTCKYTFAQDTYMQTYVQDIHASTHICKYVCKHKYTCEQARENTHKHATASSL